MPSSEPLEMMMETFSIVSLMSASLSCLDAATRLGDAADLGGELCRTFGEQLVQLLDRHAGALAEAADRRRGAAAQVGLAHEVDHLPVAVGEGLDAVGAS